VWKRLADAGTPNIWFVDSAISKIWLHTKTYTEFFAHPVTDIKSYFEAYNLRLVELGLCIQDLCREGTVVYGTVQPYDSGVSDKLITPEIVDLRAA
jgi:hypothetical protein